MLSARLAAARAHLSGRTASERLAGQTRRLARRSGEPPLASARARARLSLAVIYGRGARAGSLPSSRRAPGICMTGASHSRRPKMVSRAADAYLLESAQMNKVGAWRCESDCGRQAE